MIIYTQASFDILHRGHINLLRKCKKLAGQGGTVIVSLLTDEAYTRYRGHSPALPFSERVEILLACRYVDVVHPGDNTKTKEEIAQFNPDFVVLGTDWAEKDIYKQYSMTPEQLDPLLWFTPYTKGISSSEIKKRIKT